MPGLSLSNLVKLALSIGTGIGLVSPTPSGNVQDMSGTNLQAMDGTTPIESMST